MEQVQIAVKSLHIPSDPQVDAWNISVEMLTQKDNGPEVRFFAAQTIKHKIVSDFSQLEDNMVASLKSTLWGLIRVETGKAVIAQLILALAALIVQSTGGEVGSNPVEELLSEADSHPEAVLGILACIPEQMVNPLIHMSGSVVQAQRRRILEMNVDRVISLVTHTLPMNSTQSRRESIFACLLSWIKYGTASPEIIGSEAILGTVLQALFEDVQNESETLSTSCEVVCELFFRLFQISDAPSSGFLSVLVEGLDRIRPGLYHLLKIEEADGEEETPALSVGKVFLEAGEAFLPWIVNDPKAMQIILEAALMLAENTKGNLKMVEATFSFWNSLEERLSTVNEATKEPFIPVISRLFQSLVFLHLGFPINDTMTAEERDQFRDFRHVIGDCLKDCTRIIGSTEALSLIVTMLKEVSSPWQKVEAILFSLRTISSSVDRRESEAMPVIATILLQLVQGSPNPKLVYAVILNIGCYADWVKYHSEFLTPFLTVLVSTIGEHSAASSMALKYLCQSCSNLLVQHEATLRSLYTQSISRVPPREMQDLTEAVANILLKIPEESLSLLLPNYLGSWIPILSSQPSFALDNLSIFIELLTNPSPTLTNFLNQLLSNLPSLVEANAKNEQTMESLIILLRSIVAHHQGYCLPLVDLLDSMFSHHGIAGSLYVIRQIVISEPTILPYQRCIQSLTSALDCVERKPIGLADLMQLSTGILDFYDQFTADPILVKVLHICQVILTADPVTPTELVTALLFLSHLLQRLHGTDPKPLESALSPCLHSLHHALLQVYPTNVIPDCASVLRRHHQLDPDRAQAYFSAWLAALPFLTDRERVVWMEKWRVAVEGRPREMKEMLVAFISTCRRRI